MNAMEISYKKTMETPDRQGHEKERFADGSRNQLVLRYEAFKKRSSKYGCAYQDLQSYGL